MPQSQLKRLKASLREQGIVGPQKSKKQKAKGLSTEQKIRRNVALESIRENFNPFEVKHLSRPAKRDITTQSSLNGKVTNGALGRPGVTKSLGEQKRRQTLLLEVQNRNKVGGIVDRRIGEDDATMGAEEKALQRYTWERQRRAKKGASAFDLEGGDEDEELLTHGGRALEYNGDYDAASVEGSENEDDFPSRKRAHEDIEDMAPNQAEDEPDRKKSRAEIMEEVVKKSKLHKFERQRAKEEDDDVRIELDKDLSDVRAALSAFQQALDRPKAVNVAPEDSTALPALHPDRAALMDGVASQLDDKSYDLQLRKIANDKRAKPTDRIRTEEEISQQAADKTQELEAQRLKRMAGLSDEDSDDEPVVEEQPENIFEPEDIDDAAEFGFQSNQTKIRHTRPEGIDDEDDFLIEDDFIARDSASDSEVEFDAEESEESDDDLLEIDASLPKSTKSVTCPRTLEQVEAAFEGIGYSQYHETIRTIRLRTDPAGHSSNKSKLEDLSASLVEYIAVLPSKDPKVPSEVLDVIIRHIHSMARKSSDAISNAFRQHLREMHASKSMTPGDLVILTAIGAIYPTSDHFHQIVTPAIILMARWLGLTASLTPKDSATGAFLSSLCLKYQSLSKRYIPELMRFTTAAISIKAPKHLLAIHVANLLQMATLWSDKPAFVEIFTPTLTALKSINATKAITRLTVLLNQSALARQPLQLHNHRPLAIKSAVPRFEEGFDPSKHYDPDADRAETQRLTKEFKKEKKGAMRELRKDANFLAREKLRETKEKDRAYDDKYKRLVAEIQGEEGRESKLYEKEKMARKGKR
jgi:nucleolar protein 14